MSLQPLKVLLLAREAILDKASVYCFEAITIAAEKKMQLREKQANNAKEIYTQYSNDKTV